MVKRAKFFLIFIIINSQLCIPFVCAEPENILKLDIDKVSQLALKNNFDIQVYRIDQSISEKELLKAKAVYDTEIDASYEYDEDRLKRTTTILGSKITNIKQKASIAKEFPTGTVLSLDFLHQREASDSSFSTLNPYHESETSISVTQPIGENALGIIDRNNVKITRLDIENTGYTSTDKIEQELADVQKAYWSLLLANKEVDLTQELLESAKSLYEANKKNFEIGMVELPEFYAVDANLKERQNGVLLAGDTLNSALNMMRLKLNLKKDTVVMPVDDFDCEELTYSFEDLIPIALNNRRDYKSAKNDTRAMDLYVEMKKNSLWPQIDLKGTFKKNGLDREFRNSIREITSQDYPEYIIEVVFSFPLENSTARAEYSQKELQKAKALVNLKKTECLILVEVHDAFIHAQSAYNSAKLLKQAMELQHKKYLGEKDRFKKGRSDTDRLIRYQNDYLNSKLNYLNSLYKYKAAIIDLKTTMNMLLQEEES